MPFSDRAHVLDLLNRLGSENDADVLQAARDVSAVLEAEGLTWDEVIEVEQIDPPSGSVSYDAPSLGEDDDPAAIIAKLLTVEDLSDTLREELEGYRDDIAEGEFTDDDAAYLRALHARLSS